MRRALFAREFRSALVPNLVTVGVILATIVVVERLYGLRLGKAEDVRAFTDLVLLAGLVISGFISGERCFPTELKESRILFLSSLPISRNWVWLVIVSGRLLAAVVSLVLTVALRRPLLTALRENSPLPLDIILLTVSYILFTYILFFSAGTLFALLFRRPLFSYVAGFLILGLLLARNYRGLLRVQLPFGLRTCTLVAPRISPEAPVGDLSPQLLQWLPGEPTIPRTGLAPAGLRDPGLSVN